VKAGDGRINRRNELIAKAIRDYSIHTRHDITVVIFSEEAQSMLRSIEEWKRQFQGLAEVQLIDTTRDGFHLPYRFGYKYMYVSH